MADSLRKILDDRIWAILEGWTPFTNQIKAAERIKQTPAGWLRKELSRGTIAGDIRPTVSVDFDQWTHSGYTLRTGLDKESATVDADCPFPVVRSARVTITVRYPIQRTNNVDLWIGVSQNIIDALFNAGPHIGLDEVVETSQITGTERDPRADEKPNPGRVVTVTQTIITQQTSTDVFAESQET